MDLAEAFKKYVMKLETTYDVDTTDRFKYTYTTWILTFSAFAALAYGVFDKPMSCWVPQQFHGSWKQYVENYCYVEGTYFVPMNLTNLPHVDQRMETKLNYYQWVPFILLTFAVVTYLPRLLWKQIQSFQDVRISTITAASRKDAKSHLYTGSTYELCDQNRADEVLNLFHRWKAGNLLTATLLITKFVSIIVIMGQTVALDWFLSGKIFNFYGIRLFYDILDGRDWRTSGVFPRTTFCDVQVREMAAVQTWTVQCVLKANMYYEKLFLLIWLWYFSLTIVSLINFVKWIYWSLPYNQVYFLRDVIKIFDEDAPLAKVQKLYRRLQSDGTTVARLVKENSNLYNTAKFLKPIWDAMEDFKND
ncbi:unnamed protein product [Auanema sp. JU1783]|nr:unnamed protein product [Auanema sp. JU1783]